MTNLLIKLFVKSNSRKTGKARLRERYGVFASIVGIATNVLLFIIKLVVGLIANSISIVADAMNNLSDSGASIVTLVGFKISGKPADAEHPFGHARAEYISSLIVSFIIVILGFELIIRSIEKIISPETIIFNTVTVLVLVISILIKFWQSQFYKNIAKIIDSPALIATSVDSRNDMLATLGVLLGIIITNWTGFNLDGYIGLLIAFLILISGVKLVMETINPLLGEAPTKELVNKISKKILSYDDILGIHDLTVHSYGKGKCYASVHCEVSADQDIMVSHDIIDNIERDFLKEDKIHLVIHLDPVVIDDERTNKLKNKVEKIINQISPHLDMHDFRVAWGVSHCKLIFDVAVPFDFEYSEKELVELISAKIYQINENYHSVITIDRSYT
ncbi:MAG: cation transporter [Peptococcaceae bacterium]|nr:cation transporter [Peptococcaceae bacterium]